MLADNLVIIAAHVLGCFLGLYRLPVALKRRIRWQPDRFAVNNSKLPVP